MDAIMLCKGYYYDKFGLPAVWNTYRGRVRGDSEMVDRGQITRGLWSLDIMKILWISNKSSSSELP